MFYKKSVSFVEVFNEKLAEMEPNGLMEYWRRIRSFSTTKVEEIGPQVLTMDHLTLGFFACCIPMVLAVIAFIGEFVWSKLVTSCRKNSNDSRKSDQKRTNCSAKVCPTEFRRTKIEENNVEPEEQIEMHDTAVAKLCQKVQVDWEDLIESYHDDDPMFTYQKLCDDIDDAKKPKNKANCDAKHFSLEFCRTQPQENNVEPEDLIEVHGIAVVEIHQKAQINKEDLIRSYDDDDLGGACQELCDEIDDLVDHRNFTPNSKKA